MVDWRWVAEVRGGPKATIGLPLRARRARPPNRDFRYGTNRRPRDGVHRAAHSICLLVKPSPHVNDRHLGGPSGLFSPVSPRVSLRPRRLADTPGASSSPAHPWSPARVKAPTASLLPGALPNPRRGDARRPRSGSRAASPRRLHPGRARAVRRRSRTACHAPRWRDSRRVPL